MSAYILIICIDKINSGRKVRISPHDSGTVKDLLTRLVLLSTHDYVKVCACVSFSALKSWVDIVRTTKEVKWRKVGEHFLGSGFM